jgi:hypothetical protein
MNEFLYLTTVVPAVSCQTVSGPADGEAGHFNGTRPEFGLNDADNKLVTEKGLHGHYFLRLN